MTPLARRRIPSLPCTPAPSLSWVAREGTVTGGQNFRHSLVLHSRWLVGSGLTAYSVWPGALPPTAAPGVALDAEPIIPAALPANAIAASEQANASVAAPVHIASVRGRPWRRGRMVCCLAESVMGLLFAGGRSRHRPGCPPQSSCGRR